MSTKRPTDSDDDENFFDDDLFDSDLFDSDDDDSIVVRHSVHKKSSVNSDEDDSLFDSLLNDKGVELALLPTTSLHSGDGLFEEDHTEIIMDDDIVLPNTYFTNEQGKVFHVRRTPFLIGRAKECDLVINVQGVSRRHAELTFGAGNFVVRDLDSLNGTRVNGIPVPQTRLNDSDVLQLGRHQFSFFTYTPEKQTRPRAHTAQRNAPRQNKEQHSLSPGNVSLKTQDVNVGQNNSDFLVKMNFIIIAIIIGVTLGYVAWEDLRQVDDHQQLEIQDPVAAGDQPLLPTAATIPSPDKNTLALDGDWTQAVSVLPPLDDDLEQMAKAVEAQMENRKPADSKRRSVTEREPEQRSQKLSQRSRQDDLDAIKDSEARLRKRQAKRDAEDVEQALEQRSIVETNEAQSLLGSVRSAYMSGDKLSDKILRMNILAKSNALNGRMRRELGNTSDIYGLFIDQFYEGDRLYEAGKIEAAFQIWQQLLSEETTIVGSEKSYFAREISTRVIEMTEEKARLADADGDFAEALKLYQKLVQLRPDGPYKSKIEQMLAGAEEQFAQAQKMMTRDPGQAVRMLQSVMDSTPRDHPLHIRAESKLVWMKEGL